MTEQELTSLGPSFASFLRRFRGSFGPDRPVAHVDTYRRGLLSDLPRKSIEPIALEAGTGVRARQEFLVTARGPDLGSRHVTEAPGCRRRGPPERRPGHGRGHRRDQLPRVGRPHARGAAPVPGVRGQGRQRDRDAHIGVTKGAFPARLDADLFVPASWAADRDRCERAGIPDGVGPRTTWRGAVDQWLRATGNGWSFDWLVLDAGYGAAVPFLRFLNLVHPPLVADVPVNVRVRDTADAPARRADARRSAPGARGGKRDRIGHWTVRASFWRATAATVWVADREHTLVAATNGATGEVQYSVTNAATTPLARVLAVVFRRWTVERAFRLGKQEAGVWITRAGTTPGWFGTWPWWCWGSWPPARAPAPAVTAVTAAPAEPAHGR